MIGWVDRLCCVVLCCVTPLAKSMVALWVSFIAHRKISIRRLLLTSRKGEIKKRKGMRIDIKESEGKNGKMQSKGKRRIVVVLTLLIKREHIIIKQQQLRRYTTKHYNPHLLASGVNLFPTNAPLTMYDSV